MSFSYGAILVHFHVERLKISRQNKKTNTLGVYANRQNIHQKEKQPHAVILETMLSFKMM